MTEEQKIKELLKPRYKVIADWPGRQFFLTAILNIHEPIPDGRIRMWIEHNDQKEWYLWNNNRNGNIDDYPHLFRKLEWHEERDASEMPDYVKPDPNGIIESLAKSEQVFDARGKWELEIENFWLVLSEGHHIHASHLLPATAADYHACKQPA